MDLSRILAKLREELENLDAAILSLERLQQESPRRGRPPKALSQLSKTARAAHQDTGDDGPISEED